MFYCEKCKKQHKEHAKAEKCCGLDQTPCLTCKAKNFCQNKEPKNPIRGAYGDQLIDLWQSRGCL